MWSYSITTDKGPETEHRDLYRQLDTVRGDISAYNPSSYQTPVHPVVQRSVLGLGILGLLSAHMLPLGYGSD